MLRKGKQLARDLIVKMPELYFKFINTNLFPKLKER